MSWQPNTHKCTHMCSWAYISAPPCNRATTYLLNTKDKHNAQMQKSWVEASAHHIHTYIHTYTVIHQNIPSMLNWHATQHIKTYMHTYIVVHISIQLIPFELAGEDRDRKENPVVSSLKIAFYALHKRGWTGFPPCSRILRLTQMQAALGDNVYIPMHIHIHVHVHSKTQTALPELIMLICLTQSDHPHVYMYTYIDTYIQ